MKISIKEWFLFTLIAVFCLFLWYSFSYPQFAFVDLSVNKNAALAKAEAYLQTLGVDTSKYRRTIAFDSDNWADRYLQKTLGVQAEGFIKRHAFELFSWRVRFFKQFQKEEYAIEISPKTGDTLSFQHLIDDISPREQVEKEAARQRAEGFLKENCNINLQDYAFHEEKVKRFDRRTDYYFSWEKKGVYVPWKEGQGAAKLLIGATVSGSEIRQFFKSSLDIPEKFHRYIENQLAFGGYLSSISFLLFISLVVCAILIVVRNARTLVIRQVSPFFFYLASFFVIANIAYVLNDLQGIFIEYPTSVSLASYIGVYIVRTILSLVFLSANFILSGLAGESLRQQVFPDRAGMSFLHYKRSTFFGRSISKSIIFGYVLFIILLGLQAVIFHLGQRYLGVWKEWVKLTQFSSSCIPFLGAFVIAVDASFSEEVLFRIFSISWFKRYLKNTALAVILSSLIWGFGHSEYAIFPVWFRGIEVSILGIAMGFVFIRYGVIPLVVAHYLFDLFWGVSPYILGKSSAFLTFGSLIVLVFPLMFAAAAFFLNRDEKEREVKIALGKNQMYNLNVLITFISAKKSQGLTCEGIKEELLRHNWDPELVELALKEVFAT